MRLNLSASGEDELREGIVASAGYLAQVALYNDHGEHRTASEPDEDDEPGGEVVPPKPP